MNLKKITNFKIEVIVFFEENLIDGFFYLYTNVCSLAADT